MFSRRPRMLGECQRSSRVGGGLQSRCGEEGAGWGGAEGGPGEGPGGGPGGGAVRPFKGASTGLTRFGWRVMSGSRSHLVRRSHLQRPVTLQTHTGPECAGEGPREEAPGGGRSPGLSHPATLDWRGQRAEVMPRDRCPAVGELSGQQSSK